MYSARCVVRSVDIYLFCFYLCRISLDARTPPVEVAMMLRAKEFWDEKELLDGSY